MLHFMKSGRPREGRPSVTIDGGLAGAPLDFVKLVAAALMVVDHANAVFLDNQFNGLWKAGRVVFPLFCFALAYNLRSGAALGKYVAGLLLLGLVSQPITFYVLPTKGANILFTLAAGAVLLTVLRRQPAPVQHLAFFCAALTTFLFNDPTRAFIDFGITGMLLPAVFFFVLEGRRSHIVWAIGLLFGLNWYGPEAWQFEPATIFLIEVVGGAAILGASIALAGRPRFLPRYALHAFYPGHLVLLAVLHGVL
jgi:hypothetical protein